MANSGLRGPYTLSNDGIDGAVFSTSPGAYALGKVGADGTFLISRVGRSDGNVNSRLKSYIGQYGKFKFEYYGSAKAAFEKECHLYHDFNPPDNDIHPDRPKNANLKCPRCRVFD